MAGRLELPKFCEIVRHAVLDVAFGHRENERYVRGRAVGGSPSAITHRRAFATGGSAVGGIAVGGVSCGLFAFGGLGAGLLTFAGFGLGFGLSVDSPSAGRRSAESSWGRWRRAAWHWAERWLLAAAPSHSPADTPTMRSPSRQSPRIASFRSRIGFHFTRMCSFSRRSF